MPRASLRRLFGFELLALASLAAAILTLRVGGIGVGWWTMGFTAKEVFRLQLPFFVSGILLQVVFRFATRQPVRPYLAALRKPGWWWLWLRLFAASILLVYSYLWLKLSVPLLNPLVWDEPFWQLDAKLHLGFSPTLFALDLFRDTALLRLLDVNYGFWLGLVLLAQAMFCASDDDVLRRRYAFSVIALYTLGVWCYIALPALGPAYTPRGAELASVRTSMPVASASQAELRQTYSTVLRSRDTGIIKAPFNPSHGIAAMPSLHVGVVWLNLLWFRRRSRALALFFAFELVFTFLGSLVTGWHYAIDGYVGIVLAQLSYWAGLAAERGREENGSSE